MLALPFVLQPIVLSYLCPLETPGAIQILHSKTFQNSLEKWIKSLEITMEEVNNAKIKCQITRVNGKIHCNSSAAVEYHGNKEWYNNEKRHRDNDLPAREYADGSKEWYVDGKRHRDNDLPAIELPNGTKEWYVDGKRHRDNDKPAILYADGTKVWYTKGIFMAYKVEPVYG